MSEISSRGRGWLASALVGTLIAVVTFAIWWAWMAWRGMPEGVYEPWQVAGCVLSLLALGAIAPRFISPVLAGVIITVSLPIAVYFDWAPEDDTGLFMVGVIMIGMGTAFCALVVLSISGMIWRALEEERQVEQRRRTS